MEFRFPAYFLQNGERVVTPEPRLIVGSRRWWWNASAGDSGGLAVGEVEWRGISRGLRFTGFDLRTVMRDAGYDRRQAGFVGTATLRLAKRAPDVQRPGRY